MLDFCISKTVLYETFNTGRILIVTVSVLASGPDILLMGGNLHVFKSYTVCWNNGWKLNNSMLVKTVLICHLLSTNCHFRIYTMHYSICLLIQEIWWFHLQIELQIIIDIYFGTFVSLKDNRHGGNQHILSNFSMT